MNPSSRCTLRSVAAEAGVSVATASLALNGGTRISAATTRRVRVAAARLGYRKDLRVSEFMRQVRRDQRVVYRETIALLDTWPTRKGWHEPAANQHYAEGIDQRAHELGYEVEEIWTREPGMSDRRIT
ncbi:MAG: LacI family DNA-binding transcriptional regulator, partial [Opitutaceae bacterium]